MSAQRKRGVTIQSTENRTTKNVRNGHDKEDEQKTSVFPLPRSFQGLLSIAMHQ
jgi:hypothetical protein